MGFLYVSWKSSVCWLPLRLLHPQLCGPSPCPPHIRIYSPPSSPEAHVPQVQEGQAATWKAGDVTEAT